MEFANWDEGHQKSSIPLPTDDFDQYFNGCNDIDNIFNDTLAGLLDLDVPSGFASHHQDQQNFTSQPSGSPLYRKHGRKISGTAIFGFASHDKNLSIGGSSSSNNTNSSGTPVGGVVPPTNDLIFRKNDDFGTSVSPGQLLKTYSSPNRSPQHYISPQHPLEDEEEELHQLQLQHQNPNQNHNQNPQLKTGAKLQEPAVIKTEDFLVTNESPKAYKFPPLPSEPKQPILNNFSAKYLREFNANPKVEYADDIEPLLDQDTFHVNSQSLPFNNRTTTSNSIIQPPTTYKFVPIPVQIPRGVDSLNNTKNVFLPPPSPPNQSSPDWSSPEPQSPSPSRYSRQQGNAPYENPHFSSPIHPQNGKQFYTPQFFSDNQPAIESTTNLVFNQSPVSTHEQIQHIQQQQLIQQQILQQQQLHHQHQQQRLQSSPIRHPHSSPSHSINSSPVRYYSPLRNVTSGPGPDDSIDVNATIVQLTPLKENNFQSTPTKIDLKWSPILSPNAKSSKDVRKAIQDFTPKRKVEKTSLLPPGQLDQYWEGPDENKVFTCVFNGCGKKFTRRYNVRSHIQTHLSDRPFACIYCPKKFVRQHDLNRHVKGHQEARYCKCPCGKEFARLDAMRKHRARNICVGGDSSQENHCIVKPKKKSSNLLIDDYTSDLLSSEISQMTR